MGRTRNKVVVPAILLSLFVVGCSPGAAPAPAAQNQLPS
jgi:PBP1b-binding outer membrane lipoprotein LpoB